MICNAVILGFALSFGFLLPVLMDYFGETSEITGEWWILLLISLVITVHVYVISVRQYFLKYFYRLIGMSDEFFAI